MQAITPGDGNIALGACTCIESRLEELEGVDFLRWKTTTIFAEERSMHRRMGRVIYKCLNHIDPPIIPFNVASVRGKLALVLAAHTNIINIPQMARNVLSLLTSYSSSSSSCYYYYYYYYYRIYRAPIVC